MNGGTSTERTVRRVAPRAASAREFDAPSPIVAPSRSVGPGETTERVHETPLSVRAHGRLSGAAKRLMDICVALLILALTLPFLLACMLLVRLTTRQSAIFRHRRLGRNGVPFTCLKLRTMHPDAEARLAHLLEVDSSFREEWLGKQKVKRDPRVTRIGAFLRRTNADELPQLFNVLAGQMSLVGPRPIVEEEVERYGRSMEFVHLVRPGLTGLWQISGRSDTTYERRVELDVQYVREWSLWGDVVICLRTVGQLLTSWRSPGAY